MTIKLVSALDNGGETFDRYTLCFEEDGEHFVYGASENPTHPQGFCQFAGKFFVPHDASSPHLGRPIAFDALPEKVRKFVCWIEEEVAA